MRACKAGNAASFRPKDSGEFKDHALRYIVISESICDHGMVCALTSVAAPMGMNMRIAGCLARRRRSSGMA